MIRPLTQADTATIWAFMQASADYIWMEREEEPRPYLVEEYLTDAPPGIDPPSSHRAGLFDGETLVALAELAFGFPGPQDSFLGLMMVRSTARGNGAGARLLRHLEEVARARGAARMFLAVLDGNPRGRAFWTREGFTPTGVKRTVTLGQKTQASERLFKPL